jgi:hypothetical protein
MEAIYVLFVSCVVFVRECVSTHKVSKIMCAPINDALYECVGQMAKWGLLESPYKHALLSRVADWYQVAGVQELRVVIFYNQSQEQGKWQKKYRPKIHRPHSWTIHHGF